MEAALKDKETIIKHLQNDIEILNQKELKQKLFEVDMKQLCALKNEVMALKEEVADVKKDVATAKSNELDIYGKTQSNRISNIQSKSNHLKHGEILSPSSRLGEKSFIENSKKESITGDYSQALTLNGSVSSQRQQFDTKTEITGANLPSRYNSSIHNERKKIQNVISEHILENSNMRSKAFQSQTSICNDTELRLSLLNNLEGTDGGVTKSTINLRKLANQQNKNLYDPYKSLTQLSMSKFQTINFYPNE